MKRGMLVTVTAALLAARCHAAPREDVALLTSSYLRTLVCDQTRDFAAALSERAGADADEVLRVTAGWREAQLREVRQALEDRFGGQAREVFSRFAHRHTGAERAGDAAYLAQLSAALGISPVPADYPGLTRALVQQGLGGAFGEASMLLSEVETWLALRASTASTPPLDAWMRRGAVPAAAPPPSRVEQLARGEPVMPAVAPDEGDSPLLLDEVRAERKSRRDRIFQEAQAGMERIAAERRTAEEEYGAKKLAAAEAEAAAMVAQAERLAATEEEAMKQRERSWGNKIKGVVGTLVSTFTGAVTGSMSTALAEQAVANLFP